MINNLQSALKNELEKRSRYGLPDLIKKCSGAFRFYRKMLLKRGSVTYDGAKQYLGRSSSIQTSQHGKIRIGKALFVSDRSLISAQGDGEISIGDNNFINTNVTITAMERIRIGDNNLIAQNVVIVDHNHCYKRMDLPICRQGFSTRPVEIGSDCWICANTVICAGAKIGDHVIVAANSVVTGGLEKPGVYAGSPARMIKER